MGTSFLRACDNAGMSNERKLLPTGPMARRLRVPVGWLRQEAEARRVPALRAGRVFLFDPNAVEIALLERAGKGETDER